MDRETNKAEYVEASSGARVAVFVILVLGLVAVYLVSGLIENISPGKGAASGEIEQAIAKLAAFLDYLLLFSLLLSTTLSVLFIRLGSQTSESGRYPPPGFSVLRRTRILTGNRAKKFAGLSYALAIVAWLPVIATLFLKWLLNGFL